MAEKQRFNTSTTSIHRPYNGIVFSITDGEKGHPPVQKTLDTLDAYDWFAQYPEDIYAPIIKLLAHQIEPPVNGFDIPFSKKIIDEAIWHSEVYSDWTGTSSGSCAALLDSPVRFTLQTPTDGFPFISMALSKKGHICKGIMTYDNAIFDPILIMPGEPLISGWRSDGLQIISIPQAILKAHSAWLSRTIADTLKRLQGVEEALTRYNQDYSSLLRTLHSCQDTVLNLERRTQFELVVMDAIESTVAQLHKRPWSALAPVKAAIQLRRADLDVIPKRIEIARISINDTILQRTQLQSLEIAQATQRIGEATMRDSASMKTIAILTMIFLPGTAVASFFSMTMWDWSASNSSELVSSWIWVYFVVAAPLTMGVIAFWYFWMQVRERQMFIKRD